MQKTEFVYVTYISATAEQVWKALTEPEITTKYWQHVNVSDWKPGSRWEHRDSGIQGDVLLLGNVVESKPPRRLAITWADPEPLVTTLTAIPRSRRVPLRRLRRFVFDHWFLTLSSIHVNQKAFSHSMKRLFHVNGRIAGGESRLLPGAFSFAHDRDGHHVPFAIPKGALSVLYDPKLVVHEL